jgi:hypothetical protein
MFSGEKGWIGRRITVLVRVIIQQECRTQRMK